MAKQTDKIRTKWEGEGWYVINLIATSKNGICDYLMLKAGHVDVFVESKEKLDKLSDLQKIRINEMLALGKKVYINNEAIKAPFIMDKLDF